ncbi:Gfo/Idh/MocA family protein [Paenibacillus favisporus]|uniref:Gfo/Idh/MocA family protein n=1 Tax=Paenibacillus favisporus TaxID=221028 RepID=UPI0013D2EA7F|nr:Gfo/Idh/MocA family oxidoreductase [Paenibacillus favisporus]
MKNQIKVGIIGTGFMGKAHAEGYQLFNIEVGMFASQTEAKAKAAAEQFGVDRWTLDWLELVNDPEIDCVDITAPNHLHYDMAMACIHAGKPFLIEKPLARSTAEAEEIVRKAKEKGIIAVYAENMRFKPALMRTKELVDQGAFGKIMMLRSNEIHNGPFHSPWFWDAKLTGGGAAIDMGIHGVNTLEWIMNSKIKRVYAETEVLKWKDYCKNGAEDTAIAVLRFENGGLAEIVISWAVSGGMDVRLEVFGDQGTGYVSTTHEAGGLRIYSNNGYGKSYEQESGLKPHVVPTKGWSFPAPKDVIQQGHAFEVKHFIDCVRGIAKPSSTLEDGLRALAVIEAMYQSAQTGMAVQVKS